MFSKKNCRTNGHLVFQSRDFRELSMPGQAVLVFLVSKLHKRTDQITTARAEYIA